MAQAQKQSAAQDQQAVEQVKATLNDLIKNNFLVLKAGSSMGSIPAKADFVNEMAKNYVRIRNLTPDLSKLDALKSAITATQANDGLNFNLTSGTVVLNEKVTRFMSKADPITNHLGKLV